MTVSVHIVNWNHRQFLGPLLESLRRQTYPIERILIVDNASTDGSIELLSQEPGIHLLRFTRNTGFSHGHNQAIAVTKTDAVLVTNPDLLLEPDCIQQLVDALQADAGLGAVTPCLMRYTLSADDLREPVRSDTMDAAGLILRRSRQALNRGEGTRHQFEQSVDIFGATGALALYRRAALDDVALHGEVFDEDFFAYKEDVDLACRLRWANWRTRYIATARAYHHRGLAHHGDSVSAVMKSRGTASSHVRILSYRNHFLMLMKNETAGTFWPNLTPILWYELKKFTYLLFREPRTLAGLGQAIKLLPRMSMKRRWLKDRRRITAAQFRNLLTP